MTSSLSALNGIGNARCHLEIIKSVLPYPGRSKMSSSSYQTGQDCPPYQMDSLIAAVSEGEENKKHESMKKREHSRGGGGFQVTVRAQTDFGNSAKRPPWCY